MVPMVSSDGAEWESYVLQLRGIFQRGSDYVICQPAKVLDSLVLTGERGDNKAFKFYFRV